MKITRNTVLYSLGAIFLVLQFIRPTRNLSGEKTNDISTKYAIPAEVDQILQSACNDCHSNSTVYPWYTEIQPIGLWIQDHVNDGKKHLNFSIFTGKKLAWQNHKFEEIIEMVEKKEMPLNSYTWIHGVAKLSEAQRQLIIHWAKTQMDTLKARYPADSLVLKRK